MEIITHKEFSLCFLFSLWLWNYFTTILREENKKSYSGLCTHNATRLGLTQQAHLAHIHLKGKKEGKIKNN